jgi:hypothetical protein
MWSGIVSRRYQFFWEVVGLERGTLSLVSTIQELLEIQNSGSGLEIRKYDSRDPSRWPRGTLYPPKLAPTFLIAGGLSVGIVRYRTHVTEFLFRFVLHIPTTLVIYKRYILEFSV